MMIVEHRVANNEWRLARHSLFAILALFVGLAIALLPMPQLITLVAIVVGLVAIAAIFHEPMFGLALVMIVGPFQPLERVSLQLPIDSGQIILGLTLLSYLARALATRRSPITHYRAPIVIALAAFAAVGLLSFFPARDFANWANECIKWLEVLSVALLVMNERDGRKRAVVIGAILLSATGQAIYGIIQADVRGFGPHEFQVLGSTTNFRAYGTFEQPNPFGGYMGLVWPLAAGVALSAILDIRFCPQPRSSFFHVQPRATLQTSGPRPDGPAAPPKRGVPSHLSSPRVGVEGQRSGLGSQAILDWLRDLRGHAFQSANGSPISKWVRDIVVAILAGAVAAVCMFALVASGSRGGLVGAVAAVLMMGLALLKHPLRWVGAAMVCGLVLLGLHIVSIPLTLDAQVQQLLDIDVRNAHILPTTFSTIERLAHWQAAVRMIEANPWLGVGFGNYGPAYPEFKLFIWDNALGHAHNYYLNIFAETGVIGFLTYLALWLTVFVTTWRLVRQPFVIGVLGAFSHLTAHHLFDNLYVANMHLLIGVYLGLVGAVWLERKYATATIIRA